MSRAYCCEVCDGRPDWRLERHGDAAVSWACHNHLALVCHHRIRERSWDRHARLSVMVAALPEGMTWGGTDG